jgi:TonB-linked SusC/RagA family outer membrane protein
VAEAQTPTTQAATQHTPQKTTVVGQVKDEQGEPLPGVYVRVPETKQGTVTDGDGRFTLTADLLPGRTIEFSFMGFATQTIVYGHQKKVNVTMKESNTEMDEVVVTARTNINEIDIRGKAGVVESIDMKRVEEKPMIDFALALQGQVPGLMVVNTGELGSRPQIRIRGNSSLRKGNATNEPLYVLDGKVISADVFYNLNPTDIKSIKVLKNAAACALYGVKAANGVLEISSQRGYEGAPSINYSTNVGMTMRGRRGIRMMNSAEKLELERLLQNPETPGYRYSADYYNKYFANDPNLSQLISDGQAKLDSLRGINTDWFDELLRNNIYHRHSLSVRGGNGQTSYYISGNYAYQGGRIEGNSKERMGVRLNLDQRLGRIGYLMFSVDGAYAKTKTPNGTSSNPTALVYELNPYEQKHGKLWSYPGQTYNDLMHQYEAEAADKSAGASASLTLTPLPGLDVAAVVGVDFLLGDASQFTPSTAYSEQHSGAAELARGIYQKSKNTTTNLTSNVRVTYNRTFAERHDVTIGANMDYYRTDTDNQLMRGYGVGTINSPAAINQSLSGVRQPYVSADRDKMAQVGYGGVMGYTYDNTYDLYATLKLDASSVLPRDKRWNKAWAVGIGWTPTQYAFLKDNKWVTNLNLKASYGQTANLNGVSVSQTVASFEYATSSYESTRPLDFITLYNRDLVPEQNHSIDYGFSLELLKRFTVDVNFYTRKTKEALLDVPIPSSTGFTTLKRNIGVLQNKGVEVSVNAKILNGFDWRCSIGATLAYNENKVLDLYYADRIYTYEDALVPDYEVGKSYDMLYGPVSLGIDPLTGYPMFRGGDGEEKSATKPLTKDDVVSLGHLTPPYTGTVSLNFGYKSFDFDMDFYYVHGGVQRYNYSYVRNRDSANKNAVSGQTQKMWFHQGDENKTYWTPYYTSATAEDNIALYPNSRTVGKSDYLKLSMISLRYRLPSAWTQKHLPCVKYCTVGLQASNLYTWTAYNESDPESGQLAGTTQPVITFNLNVTF